MATVQKIYEEMQRMAPLPELGIDIHPVPYQRLGFHVAVYYSYATNQTDILTYSEDGRNSMGVRVGVCF